MMGLLAGYLLDDACRHLYLPVSLGQQGKADTAESSQDHITYRRYKLTDDKTFTNLFHPDKDTILDLVSTWWAIDLEC
jgi:hypothetical protein